MILDLYITKIEIHRDGTCTVYMQDGPLRGDRSGTITLTNMRVNDEVLETLVNALRDQRTVDFTVSLGNRSTVVD